MLKLKKEGKDEEKQSNVWWGYKFTIGKKGRKKRRCHVISKRMNVGGEENGDNILHSMAAEENKTTKH